MTIPRRHTRVRVRNGVDTITINEDPLAVQLSVTIQSIATISPDANHATVTIANLSAPRRQQLAGVVARNLNTTIDDIDKPTTFRIEDIDGVNANSVWDRGDATVEVEMGYDDKAALVFVGSTEFARNHKQGPTWYTELQVGDGLSTMMTGVAARTFPPGAPATDIVKHLRGVMGLGEGNTTAANLAKLFRGASTTFPFGWTAFGDAKEMMSHVLTPFNIEWFVDRGEMYVVRKGEALAEEPVSIDFASGLLATPEPIEANRLRLRCLLRPDVRLARLVTVSGVEFSGTYRSEVVMHSANNRMGSATTEVIVAPI